MNAIDNILARIPVREVTIKTAIDSYAVIERLQHGVAPLPLPPRQRTFFFTFEGSYEGNFFKIQAHARNPTGEDLFPPATVRIGFLQSPFPIETSPVFYGRVFDREEGGALIQGHFGIPFPALGSLCTLIILAAGKAYPAWGTFSFTLSLFFLVLSIETLVEFHIERKAILDFLQGLFYDAIET